jgi:hypothetical protein
MFLDRYVREWTLKVELASARKIEVDMLRLEIGTM